MMQAKLGGERMRQRVRGAEILLERDGAHGRRHLHISARFDILAVACSALEIADDQLQPVNRDGVAQGMKDRTGQRFQTMGECVHACGRGQEWRQANSQLRIEDRPLRHQPGAEDDDLPAQFVRCDHGGAADFAAGPGGGGPSCTVPWVTVRATSMSPLVLSTSLTASASRSAIDSTFATPA